ncbi:MAG: hypothetical protein ONA69_00475 [candidate division KSB1 bacterium]|nr:hypothetical protein [candidate division KSB1 bacterium]
MPIALNKSYAKREIVHRVFGVSPTAADLHKKTPASEAEDYASQLSKSGSITRGVTMGTNRGLKVNSALNINVSGKVGEKVEVVAALTDQSTPIQPEGTTQNLQEIDKVFIQIKSPNFSTTMGDFQLDYNQTELSRYSRKLQGVMGEAAYGAVKARLSAAVSRGKYYSMQFMGQEGNQGPYQLKGDRGQVDIIVLAGTERVYIDGELMVRGETNDYTIDYSAAQITFTRRRLITSDSRITVDFQYSDEQYRRNLSSAMLESSLLQDKLKISTLFLHEADDKDNPLDFTFTVDTKRILESAGDDQTKAVVDGFKFVGEGAGRYTLRDGIFVYVGEKQGDYSVTFSDVGTNAGDYQYKGNAIFEYVGKNKGRYAPVILLPLPKSHSMLNFSLQAAPFSFLRIKSETALSQFDRNTFSPLDAQDDQGLAQLYEVTLLPKLKFRGKSFGNLSLSGRLKNINDRFADIDRSTEAEYNRRWDLPAEASREESVKEFRAKYEPSSGTFIGAEAGSIRKGDYFSSFRRQIEGGVSLKKIPTIRYRREQIGRENFSLSQKADWVRQYADVQWKFWKLSPIFRYEGEDKRENWSDSLLTGFKFDDFSGGFAFEPFNQISLTVKNSLRKDWDYQSDNRFLPKSKAQTQNYQLSFQRFRFWTTTLDYTHRVKSYYNSTTEDSRTDLAEIRSQISPSNRFFSADLNYQISNTATARKERVYIKVPQGEGVYRFDEQLNEYVYDPLGDYILRILTTDQLIPTSELKTSGRFRFEPARLFEKAPKDSLSFLIRTLNSISTETFASVEERSQDPNVTDIFLLKLSKFRSPATTVFGNLQFREDIFLFERNRDFSVRLRYFNRDEFNNQFLEGGETRKEREYSARVTSRFSEKWSSQSEITRKNIGRFFDYVGRQNRNVNSVAVNGDVSYSATSSLKLAFESRMSWEKDLAWSDPTRVKALAFVPRMTYSIKTKGRLRAEFEWSNVSATPKDRPLPYEIANGRSAGRSTRWEIRFDYRLSDVMQATLSYSGRNEPARHGVIHTGRAQVTAAFR